MMRTKNDDVAISKLWMLIIFSVSLFSQGNSFEISNTLVQSSDGGFYPFEAIYSNTTGGYLLGKIIATSSSSVSYSIHSVSYESPDNITTTSDMTPESTNIALDTSADDCSDEVLQQYSKLRKAFCINHLDGNVYTTQYFQDTEPDPGGFYKLDITYHLGPNARNQDRPPFKVSIIPICKTAYDTYMDITNVGQCLFAAQILGQMNVGIVGLNPSVVFSASVFENTKITYIASFYIDFRKAPDSFNFPPKGSLINAEISQTGSDSAQLTSSYYHGYGISSFDLKPPFKIKGAGDITISFKTESGVAFLLNTTWVHVTVLNLTDYCSDDGVSICSDQILSYRAELEKVKEECPNRDFQAALYAKYGFCADNEAPVQTKSKEFFNWDADQVDVPTLVIKDYISNTDNTALSYKISSFSYKYASNSANYFVITDPAEGSIYATESLKSKFAPDDIITLNIDVLDIEKYPPRIVDAVLEIEFNSICKSSVNTYRQLFDTCDRNIIKATMNAVDGTNADKAQYSVRIIGSSFSNNKEYFISGLIWLRVKKLDVEYIDFSLKCSDETVNTRQYLNGKCTSFSYPLERVNDVTCTISAVTNTGNNWVFDLSEYELVLIEKGDYCSSLTCVNLYATYNDILLQDSDIEKKCADPDASGFKAKYGYCRERFQYRNETYYAELSQASNAEVIPSYSSMYVFNISSTLQDGLLYQLDDVIWVGNNPSQSNSVSLQNLPPTCDKIFATKPKAFFCINSKTGLIYSTSVIAEENLSTATTFKLTMKVTEQSFPFRNQLIYLTLSFRDQCGNSFNQYQNLIDQCKIYETVSKFNDQSSVVTFNDGLPTGKKLVGIQVNKNMLLAEKYYKYFHMEIQVSQNDVIEIMNTTQVDISTELTNFYTFQFDVSVDGLTDYVKFKFFGSESEDSSSTSEQLVNINGIFMLFYLQDYNCLNQTCTEFYSQWKETTKTKESYCKSDRELFGTYYEKCINPNLEKLTTFSVSGTRESKQQISFGNCSYISDVVLPVAYILKNDATKFYLDASQFTKDGNNVTLSNTFTIPSLSLADQGSYQCVVETYNGQVSAHSEKLFLKLEDLSEVKFETKVAIIAAEQLSEDQLKAKVIEQVTEEINKTQDGGQKDFTVNVTNIGDISEVDSSRDVMFTVTYAGLSDGQRLELCSPASMPIKQGPSGDIDFQTVSYTTVECCLSDEVGEENFTGVYFYEPTLAGAQAFQNCTYNTNIMFPRSCEIQLPQPPQWAAMNYSFCPPKTETTQQLLNLATEGVNNENAENVSTTLNEILTNGTVTNTFDLDIATKTLDEIIEFGNVTEKITNETLGSVSLLIGTDKNVLDQGNQKNRIGYKILNIPERLMRELIRANIDIQSQFTEEFLAGALKRFARQKSALSFYSQEATGFNRTLNLLNGVIENIVTEAYLTLPFEALELAENISAFSFLYCSPGFVEATNSSNGVDITSCIISGTIVRTDENGDIKDVDVKDLNEKIVIELKIQEELINSNNVKHICNFLNETKSAWETGGCETITTTDPTIIQCRCDHLTNFALLLDVSQTGSNPLALQVVTWIGCGISIVGLVFTLVTYLLFRNLRKKLPAKILICFTTSLLLLLIIFLAGAEQTGNRTGCQIIAGLIQFFMLATFGWMSIEGLNLYRNFVKVFHGGSSQTKFMLQASAYAWGIPLALTILTGAIAPDSLGPENDDDTQVCIAQGLAFYLGILAPICLILLQNMIVLVLVVRGIAEKSKVSGDTTKEKQSRLATVRIAFACNVLLGTTWVFAVLAVGDLRDIFQWLFCIFNSLQGFFICLFYTIRNREAMNAWKRVFGWSPSDQSLSTTRSKYSSASKGSSLKTFSLSLYHKQQAESLLRS